LSCGIGCYDYVGSPGFFDELFFELISHFHHLVADKMYTHQNENDIWRYIRDYHEKEGILMAYNDIKKNPGLRALPKLMLNSFWGKFGQRSNMPRIKYILSEPAEYFDTLAFCFILRKVFT
jgi:hypothetical protein